MNKELRKKYLSYGRIESVLLEYPDAVNSIAALETTAAAFRQLFSKLTGIQVPKVDAVKGVTKERNNSLSLAAIQTDVVRNALKAYAFKNNDVPLAGRIPPSQTSLTEGDILSQLSVLDGVVAEAKKLGAQLTDFGAAPVYVTELETLLKDLRNKADAPRKAIDQRLLLRTDQVGVFAEMDKLIAEQLDPLVQTRIEQFPAFVEAFLLAKKKRDTQGHHKSKDALPEGVKIDVPVEMETVSTNGLAAV